MHLNFHKKADSYFKHSEWIKKHDEYEEHNEWACHELAALFYEIVILAKWFLTSKNEKHSGHKEIFNSLMKVKEYEIANLFSLLYSASKRFRYQIIEISKKDREDFLKNYQKARKLLYKKLNIRE